jgi:hypothetical protein
MKDFFQYREELLEGKLSGSIKTEMNKMQNWWNEENTKSNGALLKSGLFPIVMPPFDRLFKRGVVVMGINPGNGKGWDKKRTEYVNNFKNGQAPTAFDWETKTWITAGHIGHKNARTGNGERGKISDSPYIFDPKVDISSNSNYVKGAKKMMKDLGLNGLSSKMMWCNMIPFPSKKIGSFGKHKEELYKMSVPWVRSFLKLTKPNLVFVPMAVFDMLGDYHGMSHDNESEEILKSSNSHRFYQAGMMPDGTPVVGFSHWSTASVGGPSNPNWDEENVIAIKKDLERMLGVSAPRVSER